MTCTAVQENLVAFVYGELPPEQRKKIHQHLGECSGCAASEMELIKTQRYMSKFQLADLPANFDNQLEQKLARLQHKPQKSRRVFWAVAATLLLTIGLELLAYKFLFAPSPAGDLTSMRPGQSLFQSTRHAPDSWKERYVEKFQDKTSGKSFFFE